VLYIDVVKVDRDVAYVVIATHICFNVCSKYFICSRRMLQVFYLVVAKVDLDLTYTCMLQAYVSNVFKCFIRMFASISSRCGICLQWFFKYF
jgi:hypothetical protein